MDNKNDTRSSAAGIDHTNSTQPNPPKEADSHYMGKALAEDTFLEMLSASELNEYFELVTMAEEIYLSDAGLR